MSSAGFGGCLRYDELRDQRVEGGEAVEAALFSCVRLDILLALETVEGTVGSKGGRLRVLVAADNCSSLYCDSR